MIGRFGFVVVVDLADIEPVLAHQVAAYRLASAEHRQGLKEELVRQVSALRTSLERGNTGDSRAIFHQLSGLSGLFGMTELRDLVMALREAIGQGESEAIQQHLLNVTEFVSGLRPETANSSQSDR